MLVTREDEMLTLEDAAKAFNVPISTLRFWRSSGALTKWKRGRIVVVDPDEVRREVAQRRQLRREE